MRERPFRWQRLLPSGSGAFDFSLAPWHRESVKAAAFRRPHQSMPLAALGRRSRDVFFLVQKSFALAGG